MPNLIIYYTIFHKQAKIVYNANMWKTLKQNLKQIFFPQFCLYCKKEGQIICQDCLSLIEINEFQFCPFCSIPTRVMGAGKCKKHTGFALSGVFTAADYKNSLIKKMVANLKYRPFLQELSKPIADIIITHLILNKNQFLPILTNNSLIIPIPLFPKKEKTRGFNQSLLIAKEISSYLQMPVSTDNLLRIKDTSSQVKLSKAERWQNMANAFVTKNPEIIRNKTFFLIDDVFTTGATMEQCASSLKKAGAKSVWGIAFCRE